jgi:hypothetical protein
MKPRIQFTLRRAMISTLLIAVGLSAAPILHSVVHPGPEDPQTFLVWIFVIWFFAAITGGICCLFGRTVMGLLLGAGIGVFMLLLYPP